MDFISATEYLKQIYTRGSRPGLSRVTELLRLLKNPQEKLNIINVAGTNGKGSVSAILSEILTAAGYKTGLFTSPCIGEINECYRINGKVISGELLAEAITTTAELEKQMTDKPTGFEFEVAAALNLYAAQECSFVILEAGMGGKSDATNICVSPVLSVITDIGLDHTEFLGNTISKIAREKAGIIKPNRPSVFGGSNPETLKVIQNCAKEVNSLLTVTNFDEIHNIHYSLSGTDFDFGGKNYTLSLLGLYQPKNAAIALTAVHSLKEQGIKIPDFAVETGLKNVKWHARFELLDKTLPIIYDGAHNPHGMKMCTESIKEYFGDKKINVLMGVMADKDYRAMLDMLCPLTERAYTVTPQNPRSLRAETLADEFILRKVNAESFEDIASAVKCASEQSRLSNTPLVILGTLYMYNDVIRAVSR